MARLTRSLRSLALLGFAALLFVALPLGGPARAGSASAESAAAETKMAMPITLRASVVVEDAVIRLRDLFAGPVPGGATPVARAPAPGDSVTLDARWLSALARTYRLPWRPASRFEQAVVARASQRIGTPEIRDALRRAITARGIEGPTEIAIDGGGAGFSLPVDATPTAKVQTLNLDRESGRFAALIVAPADGPVLARGTVSGRVFRLVEVPVPVRRLAPDEVIGRDDLEWKQVRADRVTRNVAIDVDQLLGKTPRRPLRPGEPIRNTEVQRAVMVEKGRIVTLTLEKPQMSLTVRGRAMQDGAEGELIRVMNTDSNRIIQAIVVDAGTVIVARGDSFDSSY